ncbi:hypothetical protein AADZ90_002150 [Aestuariibius sp. 2305UL40-4]|uniref:hypothetical protein n=1 Tax=Aestuariibius violaceus TaxID=3234132 RepID=UPI00345E632A
MMLRPALAALTCCLAAACAQTDSAGRAVYAPYELGERPFADGAVYIIAPRGNGFMETVTLVPCRGQYICLNDIDGRALRVSQTRDYLVIRGIRSDEVYYLSPGGHGFIVKDGVRGIPIAWDGPTDPPRLDEMAPTG